MIGNSLEEHKKAIKEYKEVYKKEFGKELTDQEAEEQAENLLRLVGTIVKYEDKKKTAKLKK